MSHSSAANSSRPTLRARLAARRQARQDSRAFEDALAHATTDSARADLIVAAQRQGYML